MARELRYSVAGEERALPKQVGPYELEEFLKDAYSARKLPPVPYESCRAFHANLATDSIAKLPRIPRQSCH